MIFFRLKVRKKMITLSSEHEDIGRFLDASRTFNGILCKAFCCPDDVLRLEDVFSTKYIQKTTKKSKIKVLETILRRPMSPCPLGASFTNN